MMRWHFAVGFGAMLVLWLCALPIAILPHDPVLSTYLALFALDIPLFTLAQAHRNVLTGLGRFRSRAFAGAGRWIARLAIIVVTAAIGLPA